MINVWIVSLVVALLSGGKPQIVRTQMHKAKKPAIERSTTELLTHREAPDVSRTRDHSKCAWAIWSGNFFAIYTLFIACRSLLVSQFRPKISMLNGSRIVNAAPISDPTSIVPCCSIVIETIFAINGLGFLAWESIQRADLPMMQAIVLVLSVFYIVLTFLADVLNAWLDPRIRVA